VTGDTDTDNTGISGMERAANARLLHSAQPLTLTLDIRVQEAAAAALRAGPPAYGSAAVVMDMQGQLLGMASWPQIDPADRQQPLVFNRATLGVYELADLSDLFLFAWAQESNSADEFTEFPGAFLNRMGLLQRLSLPFETTAPLLNRPEEGAEFELGRDLAISPLQLAAALTALVNGGEYYPPALVPPQAGAAPAGTRVITQETSARLRAKLAGVPVTGIAQKMRSSGYSSDDLVASAVAIFPADAPRFLVFVLIDDIKYTGANRSREAAARAVARIGASVGIILGK
jgi:cell division protein FtsI (penicillin-binding protein 3)